MKPISEKDLFYYIKMKAKKGVEVNTSIIRKIDEYLESKEPVTEEPIEDTEPIEDEETEDSEEEETEPPEPDEPISDLTYQQIAPNMVRIRWKAHTSGDMDIIYSDEGKQELKHSVKKYTKKSIPITDQSVVIGFNKSVNASNVDFKAVVGEWDKDITEWYRPPVVKPEPTPEPDQIGEPAPQPEQPTEPSPEQPKPAVEMALIFLNGESFDTWVNGEKVKDEFDYRFDNNGKTAGVKLVSLNEIFKTLVIDKSRTEQAIKVVNRDPNNDLTQVNSNHVLRPDPPDTKFWGTPAQQNHPLGVIYSRHGDTRQKEGEHIPDPEFWKGMRDDPIKKPNDRTFHKQWSDTGKIAVSFLSRPS